VISRLSAGAYHLLPPAHITSELEGELISPAISTEKLLDLLRHVTDDEHMENAVRRARIRRGPSGQPDKATVEAYLPMNYDLDGSDEDYVYIVGVDNAGWTLEDYVIPRLASGLIFAEEVNYYWRNV
jgi:hypothetical protein